MPPNGLNCVVHCPYARDLIKRITLDFDNHLSAFRYWERHASQIIHSQAQVTTDTLRLPMPEPIADAFQSHTKKAPVSRYLVKAPGQL